MNRHWILAILPLLIYSTTAFSENSNHLMNAASCSAMEVWDYAVAMCMPRAMPDMPMTMLMLHGNAFGTLVHAEGPRGSRAFSSTNMIMADYGTTLGARHYLNVELMATAEKWTVPSRGTPQLTQVGDGYLDAQHPHNTPVMGLTFSDTVSLGDAKNFIKTFFAPRGSSTDGPIPFMHRPTGEVNPDAPLGHHVGQDVGHISSTVVGAVLGLGGERMEISTFNGVDPEPNKINMPMDWPNSLAARYTHEFNEHWFAMASTAYVKNPDPLAATLDHQIRYSASLYSGHSLNPRWNFHNAFIFGRREDSDQKAPLNSLAEEFLLSSDGPRFWGRVEWVERRPSELEISSPTDSPLAVTALTLGYTHRLLTWDALDLAAGVSVTKYLLPSAFQTAYNGQPWSEKVFLELSGMKMVMR